MVQKIEHIRFFTTSKELYELARQMQRFEANFPKLPAGETKLVGTRVSSENGLILEFFLDQAEFERGN